MDLAKEKLSKRDDMMGAYKNENRRLLLGFKRSVRLRDGDSENTRYMGEPINCMWYDSGHHELFFAVKDIISSIDISARWANSHPPADATRQSWLVWQQFWY